MTPTAQTVTAPAAAQADSSASVEHLDVLIVGAGLSGIDAAHHVSTSCPWATYAIVEARSSIGGTWDLFRYPGIRSDSDMFTFSYPHRPWDRSNSIADGDSIRDYIADAAKADGTDTKIRFNQRIRSAAWSSEDARWTVTIDRTLPDQTGTVLDPDAEPIVLTCSFLFSCSGYYRYDQGYLPDFEGMEDFQGTIVHPQLWPEDLDYADKKIVVIGSGATAVTLIPSMADKASHIVMLQRSPTYIASLPGTNPVTKFLRKVLPKSAQGAALRWTNALATQGLYQVSQRRPEAVKRALRKGLQRELPEGYDIDTHFTPRYDPWDQRLCVVPDGDLFKAISSGSASVITDTIVRFNRTGIELASGTQLDADIIITATGLDILFLGGIDLSADGQSIDVSEHLTYKGMMLDGVPNLAMAVGYANASWTLKADLTCQYVARLLNHMRMSGDEICMPVSDGSEADSETLFGLSSGYVTRAADRLPKQGRSYPWRVYHSYVRDYRALRVSKVDDGVMRFGRRAMKMGSNR